MAIDLTGTANYSTMEAKKTAHAQAVTDHGAQSAQAVTAGKAYVKELEICYREAGSPVSWHIRD